MTTYVRARHSRRHKARYDFSAGSESFLFPAPHTAGQAPTQGPEQLHLGICAKHCAWPLLQGPLPPTPPPPPLTTTFRQVRCSALLSSFLPITRIDCSLPITLTQALMTSRLNYSTPLLAAFLASQIYAA